MIAVDFTKSELAAEQKFRAACRGVARRIVARGAETPEAARGAKRVELGPQAEGAPRRLAPDLTAFRSAAAHADWLSAPGFAPPLMDCTGEASDPGRGAVWEHLAGAEILRIASFNAYQDPLLLAAVIMKRILEIRP